MTNSVAVRATTSGLRPIRRPSNQSCEDMSQRTMLIEKDNDIEVRLSPVPGRAGDVSPSAICHHRRLSPVVVSAPDDAHKFAEGRPTVVVPLPQLDHTIKPVSSDLQMSSTASLSSSSSSVSSSRPPTVPKKELRRAVSNGPRPTTVRRSSSVPLEATIKSHCLSDPPPLRLEAWTEAPGTSFKIRGAKYMSTSKKTPSEPSAFRLLTVDLIRCQTQLMGGLCSHPGERIQKALAREKETGVKELPPFIFAVNLAVPGPPHYHLVMYFAVDDMDLIRSQKTPFGRLANKFFFGDSDKFRDSTFKLIPKIKEGNFVVKSAVGSKPSIIGNKLNQIYIRDERFLELIVDIGSNSVAQKVVKLSTGYAKSLVVDMAFVLEGTSEATLPEQIMGVVRLKNLDFEKIDGKRVCMKP